MNMTGVFAGAIITKLLGESTDAGNLGHDFAMMASLVFVALVVEVIFLRPRTVNMTDQVKPVRFPKVLTFPANVIIFGNPIL